MTLQSRTLTPGTKYDCKPVFCMDSILTPVHSVDYYSQAGISNTGIFLANKRKRSKYIITYISNYNGLIYRQTGNRGNRTDIMRGINMRVG